MVGSFLSGVNAAQLVTAASTTGIFATFVSGALRWRALTQSAEKILRDHYAEELKRLTAKVEDKEKHILEIETHLREQMRLADERFDKCERERELDNSRMRQMQAEIDGLKRQIPDLSADRLLIMENKLGNKPSDKAPMAAASAQRVKDITGK